MTSARVETPNPLAEDLDRVADDVEDALDEPARRQSFEGPGGAQSVAHATVIGANSDLAGSVLGTLREPETGACLTELWQAVPGPGGGSLTVSSTMAMTDPAFGDDAAWWRLTAAPAFGPQQVADVISVRVDRALVEFVFVGTGEAVGVDIQRDTITLQTARLRTLLEALDADEECDDTAEDGDGDPCPEPTPATDDTTVESESGDGG